MKKILVVSSCTMRGDSTGLTGRFLELLSGLEKSEYQISLFDTSVWGEKHSPSRYAAKQYYYINRSLITKVISWIPGIRSFYAKWIISHEFERLIKKDHYDGIVLHQLPPNALSLINIAHRYGIKVIAEPWGSEVLRAKDKNDVKQALSCADYIVGTEGTNLMTVFEQDYHIPEFKIFKCKRFFKGVKKIIEIKDSLSRDEMENGIGIPSSNFRVLCGYNGYSGQRHKIMIDAIYQNRDFLPKGYQLVFPMTYGAEVGYIEKLQSYCKLLNLNFVVLSKFLSDEQIAYLHLITDLFIQIQPTDNGSAFMIESLFAKNQIITGKWLQYKEFEQFGVPYHLLETKEELADKLYYIFTNKLSTPIIPSQLIELFTPEPNYDEKTFWQNIFDKL